MFMQRLITSLILAPLVLLILFYAPPMFLLGATLLVVMVSGRECWLLIPTHSRLAKAAFLWALLFSIWLCGIAFPYWQTLGLVVWCLICIAVLTFPNSQQYWGYPILVAFVLLLVLPLFVQSLIRVYSLPQGKSLLLYVLFLVWAADIGAYLVGKGWGKHKMIPKVSPGKSWEGVLGGFVLSLVVALGAFFYYTPYSLIIWLVHASITVIISIFGDLFISLLKRRCHLKDTGTLIPGHGGVLDRLDSLIAAMPVFYLGLTYIPLGI